MTHYDAIQAAEHELSSATAHSRRTSGLYALMGTIFNALLVIPTVLIAEALASGTWQYVLMPVIAMLFSAPGVYIMVKSSVEQQARMHSLALELESKLTDAVDQAERESARRSVQVRRQEFETRLANALEMAQDEVEALAAVERGLAATVPESPAELLLADNSHAHLTRMAASSPTGEPPGCPVDSPDHCPAARRAQVQQFTDSDALDACPKLRGRAYGRCSAVCVPVSVMGRTVGVIHATGEPDAIVDEATVSDLGTLSKLAGARIGLLRVMAETQLQAATDSLTGLLNRRSLENKMRVLRSADTAVVVAMADLDHFKTLNDTHGHETGDRALRLFAQVLRSSLRSDDLVARYGGEEFALVLPACSAEEARTALDHVRVALKDAITNAGLPRFTVSFGVVESDHQADDLGELLTVADAALFDAKRQGRDRVVVHDRDGKPIARSRRRKPVASTTQHRVNGNGNGRGAEHAEADA